MRRQQAAAPIGVRGEDGADLGQRDVELPEPGDETGVVQLRARVRAVPDVGSTRAGSRTPTSW